MEKIYCISAKGTAFQYPEVLDRYGIKEILCLKVIEGLYYCPDLHVVFYRNVREDNTIDYGWDNAIFPDYDKNWEAREMEDPFWKMKICRIDTTVLVLTEEEFAAL